MDITCTTSPCLVLMTSYGSMHDVSVGKFDRKELGLAKGRHSKSLQYMAMKKSREYVDFIASSASSSFSVPPKSAPKQKTMHNDNNENVL